MRGDGLAFNGIEMLADFQSGMEPVVKAGDELADSAFEVHVVFPQGVVRVEEQSLTISPHRSILRGSRNASRRLAGWMRVSGSSTFCNKRIGDWLR